ncbi:MAG: haloacid dehalogenase [Chloroflexi bacterium]|nr:haloacid dehalogenase [Chloroflexota bacterium]
MAVTVGSLARLDDIAEQARSYFNQKNQARETSLSRMREVIRASANTIRAVHRHEFDRAQQLLDEARQALASATSAVSDYGDVRYAGFIHDAQKEYTEASTVFALLSGQPLPGPNEVGVDWPAYLNGLGEAVGELRRFLLDNLRRGDVSSGEELLQAMDSIYDVLVTIDYPDAMTGGLRRTTDVTRGILEKTRGDLTVAMRQEDLERQLRDLDSQIRRLDPAQGTC